MSMSGPTMQQQFLEEEVILEKRFNGRSNLAPAYNHYKMQAPRIRLDAFELADLGAANETDLRTRGVTNLL
ncbi:MAG: hypothetical protein JSR17_12775 [Proteobacteria bacterium]|nr:hypothetical protein [Pseudomonadota bacterium]